jgi:hypothetical protein
LRAPFSGQTVGASRETLPQKRVQRNANSQSTVVHGTLDSMLAVSD